MTYPTHAVESARLAFGPDALYVLERTKPLRKGLAPATATDQVSRVDPLSLSATSPPLFSGGDKWAISQMVPTTVGIYVVATPVPANAAKSPKAATSGLYRITSGRLVFVRSLADPGTLTPVTPIVASP